MSDQATLRERISNFFYAEEVPFGLALTRICLPLGMLFAAVPRWQHARELYSSDGSPAPMWVGYGLPDLLPEPSGAVAVALCTLWILSLCTLSAGWMSRTSAAIAFALTAYLGMLDSIGTLTKYTVIASHMFLMLSLSSCGTVWSVDAWIERRRRSRYGLPEPFRVSPVWPRRLIQLLLGVVYLGAAFTKMQTATYFSGDQLYNWLLTNVNFANPVGEYLSLYPPALIVFGLVTVVWECLFLFIAWNGVSRTIMLALGVLFHIMTLLTLGLIVFPMVTISMYAAFFSEQDYQRGFARIRCFARRRGKRLKISLPTPPQWLTANASTAGFCAAVALVALCGVKFEHWSDPYRMRGTDGPLVLQPMPTEEVDRLFAQEPTIRPIDKLLAFDVGSVTLGGMLADSRRQFEYGETALVQCSVTPPHEDLWVEVNLHDTEDRLVQRRGHVLTRDMIRAQFSYPIEESFPPGEYDFVLRYNDQEITRKRVRLAAREHPVASPDLRQASVGR